MTRFTEQTWLRWFQRQKPGCLYWLGFLILNGLLFLPNSWLLASSRPRAAFLHWHLEISLMILFLPFLRGIWQPRLRLWYARVFFLLYLVSWIYLVYEGAMMTLYHTTPNLFNDLPFIIGGMGFLIDGLRLQPWQVGLMILALLILLGVFYKLILSWFRHVSVQALGRGTRVLAAGLIFGSLLFAFTQPTALARPESVLRSLTFQLAANAQDSIAARQTIATYQSIQPHTIYNYAQTTRLLHRPHIYLIFVESYGSVLYKRPHFAPAYKDLLDSMETRLAEQGWAMVTGLSTSPTWGGGSWMAYTSAEFGLHIGTQPQFLAIEARYSQQPYPSLGRYLQSQGYRHIRLAPIERKLSAQAQATNDAFYGPDRWIFPEDLDYHGPVYGWGPSPPDPFSLHKARELLQTQPHAPLFFFYLTQNSHYPWAPLPPYLEDWRAFNDPHWPSPPPVREPISHRDNIQHYRDAIRYQWQTLSDFILSTPSDEEAIFILMGDHQPPRVSRKEDGYETPIHIIARDADFIQQFIPYGFEPGLKVSDLQSDMKHEALYSMLVRELVRAYGVHRGPLPYYPNGIQPSS